MTPAHRSKCDAAEARGSLVWLAFSMAAGALLIGGCAVTLPPGAVVAAAPPQWFAPLPGAGASAGATLPHNASLSGLSQWWQLQNDALLVELIDAAQRVAPSVVTARSNIAQARATRTVSGAALLPLLQGVASVSRSAGAPAGPAGQAIATTSQLGAQASWEIDVFGKNASTRDAAQERLLASQAQWHDARVVVAAEVAGQYYSLRSCEKQLAVTALDANSRAETSRLTALARQAGFGAPAVAALAKASAAEGASRLTQQRAQCAVIVKALVALTAVDEPTLAQKLARSLLEAPDGQPQQAIVQVASVPAQALGQRPDVYSAARDVSAASYDVGSAAAARLPNLTLVGSIERNQTRAGGIQQGFETWSFGPLSLKLPVFDGGASQGNLDIASARYEEAVGKYKSVVRVAVREVEEALVNLQSTDDRSSDTEIAADGYRASFAGTEARYKAGLASLVELEESRRTLLAAQSALLTLQLERRNAWIALYRALGGGWQVEANVVQAQ
jgi:outer membrane protein, multidrug efflux system